MIGRSANSMSRDGMGSASMQQKSKIQACEQTLSSICLPSARATMIEGVDAWCNFRLAHFDSLGLQYTRPTKCTQRCTHSTHLRHIRQLRRNNSDKGLEDSAVAEVDFLEYSPDQSHLHCYLVSHWCRCWQCIRQCIRISHNQHRTYRHGIAN